MAENCTLRTASRPGDVSAVREIIAATDFFFRRRNLKGAAAGYHFIIAESAGTLIMYCRIL
jgi:hypothetical protein